MNGFIEEANIDETYVNAMELDSVVASWSNKYKDILPSVISIEFLTLQSGMYLKIMLDKLDPWLSVYAW